MSRLFAIFTIILLVGCSPEEKNSNIDFETTEDFNFEDDKKITSSILKNIERKKNSRINSDSKYRYSFVKNNFNSFIKVDQQEGLGTQVETDFIELFEDHKIYASAFLPFSSLKSSDIYTEYSYFCLLYTSPSPRDRG